MTPELKLLPEKKLVGKRVNMSLVQNRTAELWRGFMPRRKEITNALNSYLFSISAYPASYSFSAFNPEANFDKWAAVEVSTHDAIPKDMEDFFLPGGLYAVFQYKGPSSDPSIFQYIYGIWLPNSAYTLDQRPHFEVLGEKYKNNDPESEEEIWIPVKLKS